MAEEDKQAAQQLKEASDKLDKKSGPQNNMRQAARDLEMTRQQALWDKLTANTDSTGTIPTADADCVDFIVICRDAKGICDELQGRDDSLLVEEFAEACRQTRGLCDDLEMMKEQRPADV